MLVSVVVPVRCRAELVTQTLLSILRQNWRPLQLVVVDNASDDGGLTLGACRDFAAEHSSGEFRVEVAEEQKPGASAARNRGLAMAKGEWVSFFDSDDQMSPDFITDMMAMADDETDVLAARTRIETGGRLRERKVPRSDSAISQIAAGQLATQGMVIRRSFLEKAGAWDEALPRWNDWELGLRLLLSGARVTWNTHRAYHRITSHSDSITGSGFAGQAESLLPALSAAERDISRYAAKGQQRSLFRALAMRAWIYSGVIRREGDCDGSRALARFAESLSVDMLSAAAGRMLRLYAAAGGRGAWRFVLSFQHFKLLNPYKG